MKSILDPTFRYISSANTDLRKTFARVRREQRLQARTGGTDAAASVSPLFARRGSFASGRSR